MVNEEYVPLNGIVLDTNACIFELLSILTISVKYNETIVARRLRSDFRYKKTHNTINFYRSKGVPVIITPTIEREYNRCLSMELYKKIGLRNFVLQKVIRLRHSELRKKWVYENVILNDEQKMEVDSFYTNISSSLSEEEAREFRLGVNRQQKDPYPEENDRAILAECIQLRTKYPKLGLMTNDIHFTFDKYREEISAKYEIIIMEI